MNYLGDHRTIGCSFELINDSMRHAVQFGCWLEPFEDAISVQNLETSFDPIVQKEVALGLDRRSRPILRISGTPAFFIVWGGVQPIKNLSNFSALSAEGILERHGGRIWAESKIGSGSTLYLSFPTSLQSFAVFVAERGTCEWGGTETVSRRQETGIRRQKLRQLRADLESTASL